MAASITLEAKRARVSRCDSWLTLAGLIMLLGVAGCTRGKTESGPRVLASIPPLAYLVERLGGTELQVDVLLPAGANPHSFEPAMHQVQAAGQATLLVRVGDPHFRFEAASLDGTGLIRGTPTVACFASEHHDHRAGLDPHAWVAPDRMRTCVARLARALMPLQPDRSLEIAAAQAQLEHEIDAIEAEAQARLAEAPRRRFYVFHPTWGHLARQFGLEQVAIEVEGKEPDPRSLENLVARARSDGARQLFVQPQFPRRSAELVAEEIGAELVVLDPMARDWPANTRRVIAALAKELKP